MSKVLRSISKKYISYYFKLNIKYRIGKIYLAKIVIIETL